MAHGHARVRMAESQRPMRQSRRHCQTAVTAAQPGQAGRPATAAGEGGAAEIQQRGMDHGSHTVSHGHRLARAAAAAPVLLRYCTGAQVDQPNATLRELCFRRCVDCTSSWLLAVTRARKGPHQSPSPSKKSPCARPTAALRCIPSIPLDGAGQRKHTIAIAIQRSNALAIQAGYSKAVMRARRGWRRAA